MSRSPAFQLYVDDLLGSGTVQAANTEEVGAYVLLMCYDWQEVGFVYDEERLANVCRLPLPRFRKAWAHLSPKFPERDGRRFNPRLEKERAKQAAWAAKATEKGKRGADVRWHGQCPPDATGIREPMPDTMPGDGFPVSRFPVTATDTTTTGKALVVLDQRQLELPGSQTIRDKTSRRQTIEAALKLGAMTVFTYWRDRLGKDPDRTQLSPERERKLVSALRSNGGDVSELLYVVDGLVNDDFLMGRTGRAGAHTGIETVFKGRDIMERLLDTVKDRRDMHPYLEADDAKGA
jgi:uncharacterized protein YdaU (DUF1376 family)